MTARSSSARTCSSSDLTQHSAGIAVPGSLGSSGLWVSARDQALRKSDGFPTLGRTIRQVSCSNAQHAFVQHLFERYRASLLGHVVDGPEAILDFDRALEAITHTLLQIRPRSRPVFLLRTTEGLSYESIAERLGVSKRTVEREMKHALDACQRKLRRSMERQ